MFKQDGYIWLTIEDFERAGISFSTITSNISKKRKSWASVVTTGYGREMLLRYDTLSKRHQSLFKEALNALENDIKDEREALIVEFIQAQRPAFDPEEQRRAGIPAARRAAWLRWLAGFDARTLGLNKTDLYRLFVKAVGDKLDIGSVPTLMRLMRRYKAEGVDALVDKRKKISKYNAKKLDEKHRQLLEYLLRGAAHKPTAHDVFELYNEFLAGRLSVVKRDTGEIIEAEGYHSLSYATVYRWYMSPRVQRLYSLLYEDNTRLGVHLPQVRRRRPTAALTMATCDDWDVPVAVEGGRKLKAYLFFDVATRHCIGYAWSFEKNTALFLEALRNTLRNPALQGFMPGELQGESNLLKALEKDTLSVLFRDVSIIPKNPMPKFAEYDIRALKYDILRKKYPEYFRGRHYARTKAYRLEAHEQNGKKALRVSEIDAFMAALIGAWNEKHPLSAPLAAGLDKQDPARLATVLGERRAATYRGGCYAFGKYFIAKDKEAAYRLDERLNIEIACWGDKCFALVGSEAIELQAAPEIPATRSERSQEHKDSMAELMRLRAGLKTLDDEDIDLLYEQAKKGLESPENEEEEDFYLKYYETLKKQGRA